MNKALSYLGLGWAALGLYVGYASHVPWTSSDPVEAPGIGASVIFLALVFFFPGLILYRLFQRKDH